MNFNKCKLRIIWSTMLAFLLLSLSFAGNIQTVKSQFSGPVYIRSDGSIDPSTAPIQRVGDVYTLRETLVGNITVEKNNVTIKNMQIRSFVNGIRLLNSSNNNLIGNNITENVDGIRIDNSTGNSIIGNNITL